MSREWSSHTFEHDGIKLVYHKKGAGEPMLLLHGITDSGLCWGRTADALAEQYTIYALDQRGHGASDAPLSGYAYTDCAMDTLALLRVIGIESAIVMGHSYGAKIGMTMAAVQPAAVSKLILIDPPLSTFPLDASPETASRERLEWSRWLVALEPLEHEKLRAWIHQSSPRWSDAECAAWADSKIQVSPNIWQAGGIQIADDWRATFAQITCPTLLVYGDAELGSLIDLSLAEQVIARLAYGQAAHVAGAGHSIQRDEFEAFMAEVNAFLQTT